MEIHRDRVTLKKKKKRICQKLTVDNDYILRISATSNVDSFKLSSRVELPITWWSNDILPTIFRLLWASETCWSWLRVSTWNAESGGEGVPCSGGRRFGIAESVRPAPSSGWGCWRTWPLWVRLRPKASVHSVLWWPPLLHFACQTGWSLLLVICLLRIKKQNMVMRILASLPLRSLIACQGSYWRSIFFFA